MNKTTIFINAFALLCLIVAFLRDKEKTRQAIKIAVKSFVRILPTIIIIIMLIGLLMGLVPQKHISKIIGEQAGIMGVFIVAIMGTFLHIPSLISFPLAASLLKNGASLTSVAVFITTLTMIGIVTLPLEIKILGKKMAILRNLLSFIIAIIIGIIIGAIL